MIFPIKVSRIFLVALAYTFSYLLHLSNFVDVVDNVVNLIVITNVVVIISVVVVIMVVVIIMVMVVVGVKFNVEVAVVVVVVLLFSICYVFFSIYFMGGLKCISVSIENGSKDVLLNFCFVEFYCNTRIFIVIILLVGYLFDNSYCICRLILSIPDSIRVFYCIFCLTFIK